MNIDLNITEMQNIYFSVMYALLSSLALIKHLTSYCSANVLLAIALD